MNEINVKKSRFRDASWFEKVENFNIPIIIGGAGGIGSWLTLFLSRVVSSDTYILLYDYDRVEEVNMAGQLFKESHIGKYKVEAVSEIVKELSGFSLLNMNNEKYTSESLISPVMFSAFDNMEARKTMFNNWIKESINHKRSIFIDGRLLAEQFQVFFVIPENKDRYEKEYLFSDSEVESENCSYKQTTHFAAAIAAKMVQGFTNWLVPDEAELPFLYEEIGGLFLTKSYANENIL